MHSDEAAEAPPIPLVPAAPPSWFERHRRTTVALAVLVGIVVGVLGETLAIWLATPASAVTQVTVQGVRLEFVYPGVSDYFGANPTTACGECPLTVNRSVLFYLDIEVHNNDPTRTHNVTGGWLDEPFHLGFIYPFAVDPGWSDTLVMVVYAPANPGTYTLTGGLDTS